MEEELTLIAKALELNEKAFQKFIDNGHIIRVSGFMNTYYRFRHRSNGFDKGTVVFLDKGKTTRIVGYPKTRRILNIKNGLKKNFTGNFVVEEKMDGYNVRVCNVNGDLIAITRGGIVCPYTTYKLRKILGNNAFFDENPELVLCGEVVGLQNPYQEKSYPESKNFGYYVFDITERKSGKALPINEKKELLKKYDLPHVKELGTFTPDDYEKVIDIVKDLGSNSREGIVIKSIDMTTVLKYTSNTSTNNDLKYAFRFWSDYGQAFFFRRIVRQAFQCEEMCMSDADIKKSAAALGESIMFPLIKTINNISKGKEITEDFDIVVPDREFGEAFVEHLNHLGAKVTINSVKEDKNGVLMNISRHYQSTNDSTKAYLDGSTWSD